MSISEDSAMKSIAIKHLSTFDDAERNASMENKTPMTDKAFGGILRKTRHFTNGEKIFSTKALILVITIKIPYKTCLWAVNVLS